VRERSLGLSEAFALIEVDLDASGDGTVLLRRKYMGSTNYCLKQNAVFRIFHWSESMST
jgi:NADPH-dependent curcumin reductase CurA